MKPASRSRPSYAGVTDSGFASVVTSTSAATGNRSRAAARTAARSSAGSSVGVPPPTKTVATVGRSGPSVSRGPAQLGDRGAGVLGAVGAGAELVGGVGVEVAVAAAGRAERHVHVEAERRRRSPRGRSRAARRARAGVSSSGRTVFICSQCAARAPRARQDAAVTSDRVVQVEVSRGVATLTLDSPANRNALSRAMRAQLRDGPRRGAGRRRGPGGRARPHRPGVLLRDGPGRGRRRRRQEQGVREFPDLLESIWHRRSRWSPSSAGRPGPAASGCWPPATSSSRRSRPRSRSPRCGSGSCRPSSPPSSCRGWCRTSRTG